MNHKLLSKSSSNSKNRPALRSQRWNLDRVTSSQTLICSGVSPSYFLSVMAFDRLRAVF